ncbi:MAG TPA: hypothetical protein VGC41_20110 [Kofleriaceae bacterium]
MRWPLVLVALAGCIPVSTWTSGGDVHHAASTLAREGSAVVAADERDDEPSSRSPSSRTLAVIRLDDPVDVSSARTTTIAELIAACPANLTDTAENRRAYPRCKLFDGGEVRLHHGHRADKAKLAIAASALAAAGDLACIAECGSGAARVSTGIGLAAFGIAPLALLWHELTKDENLKH